MALPQTSPPRRQRRSIQNLRLYRLSSERFAVDSQSPTEQCCQLVVVRADGRPARGAEVAFRIVEGPVRFAETRRKTLTLKTDRRGRCAPTICFVSTGKAVIVAQLPGNNREALAFQPYTEGLTHRLFLYTSQCVEARQGKLEVAVSALDHLGNVVTDAQLSLVGQSGSRAVEGSLRLRGNIYEGALVVRRAGSWTVSVSDARSGAVGTAHVQVLAGRPSRLRIVADPDPRLKPPYDEAVVRAVAEDSLGNRLDPRLIGCTVDGKAAKRHSLVGDEAHFLLNARGARTLDVVLTVKGAALRKRRAILCGAAWLGDPGLVLVGTRHRTPLFLTPEPKRRVTDAVIDVKYDRQQVKFIGFQTHEALPAKVASDHRLGRLKLDIHAERPLGYRDYPEGIPIGFIEWQCQAEGDSCVSLTATMSPETPPWEKCTSQKRDLRERVCVNFIYNRDDDRLADLEARIDQVGRRLDRTYNNDDTIKTCCPFIDFDIHLTGYGRANWLNRVLIPAGIANTDDSGTMATSNDMIYFGRLFGRGTTEGVRANCINFYLVDFHPDTRTNGRTNRGPTEMGDGSPNAGRAGFGVIDPDRLFADTVPHELGHALGMDHDPPGPDTDRDEDELMHPMGDRPANKIKRKGDCQTIWQNIGAY
jgi:hypothetical protein